MSYALLEIPEDPAHWAAWLERELVGVNLHDLAGQFSLLAGSPQRGVLSELMTGDELKQISASGLSVLSQEQIGRLLASPAALFQLQDIVLSEGGEYWQSVTVQAEHQRRADVVFEEVQRRLAASGRAAPAMETAPAVETAAQADSHAVRANQTRSRMLVSLTAVLVIGLGMWLLQPPAAPSWGFAKSDLAGIEVDSSSDYFNLLADAGNEWFNKRPENAQQLQKRLQTFSAGCQVLIEAPHHQLATAERDWLVTKCQAWKDKIDGLVVRLDQAPDTFDQVQVDADDVVNRLVAALRSGPA